MTYLKVDGHTSLVRDEKTNALLNTNTSDYENYMKLKKLKENESKRVESLESDINNIKSDLEEIKTLLRNLSNGS
jgi:hypothetical protein